MNKIGILINNLGLNQLANGLIHHTNEYLEKNQNFDIIAFVENVVNPSDTPHFAVMNLNEAWEYDGTLIATSLSTANKLLSFPGAKRRLFYVWDLEWVFMDGNFDELNAVYSNPKLELIARSDEYAKIIERCWNRPVKAVVDDCDIGALINHAATKK